MHRPGRNAAQCFCARSFVGHDALGLSALWQVAVGCFNTRPLRTNYTGIRGYFNLEGVVDSLNERTGARGSGVDGSSALLSVRL